MSAGTLEIIKSEIGRLLGLDGHTDPAETNGEYAPFLTGDGLRGLRLYPINKAFIAGNDYKFTRREFYHEVWDDFVTRTLDNLKWTVLTGSDGSCANAINVQTGGVDRLTSGANATHTMAANGAQTVGSRNFLASQGIRYEARLGKISALTSQSICFGLIDAITLTAPFTRATVTTTANGTNGACFLQDSASTNTKLYAVSVNAGGSPQSTALNIDVDTAAFHRYRIDIDELGNAKYYVDGALVATILLAVATTATLAPSVGMFSNATSASQTLDIDYLGTQQLRPSWV